jgi:hypothetical protein
LSKNLSNKIQSKHFIFSDKLGCRGFPRRKGRVRKNKKLCHVSSFWNLKSVKFIQILDIVMRLAGSGKLQKMGPGKQIETRPHSPWPWQQENASHVFTVW